MKNTIKNQPFKNVRDAMLELPTVGESTNVFAYSLRLMLSLKHETIPPAQYKLLCGDLQLHCERNKIETSNQICSLF